MRSTTKSALLILTVLVLITPVLLGLLIYSNPGMMRAPLEGLVRQATGLQLEIGGDFLLEPSGTPHLIAGDLTLSNPQLPDQPNLIEAKRLEISLELRPLLNGKVRIPVLQVQGADIHLQRAESGRGNWQTGESHESRPGTMGKWRLPLIRELGLSDIEFEYLQHGQEPVQETINSATASISPETGIQARIDSIINGNPYTLEITSELEYITGLPEQPFSVQGKLEGKEGEMRINGLLGWPLRNADTSLDIDFKGAKLSLLGGLWALNWPDLGAYALQAHVQANDREITLDKLTLTLGDSNLTGDIHFRRDGPRPNLKSRLTISSIPAAFLQSVEGNANEEKKPQPAGKPIDWQALNRLDLDLDLKVDRLDYRGQTFRGLQLDTRLEAGKLEARLEPLEAFSKQLQGRLLIDASTEKVAYELQAASTGLRFKDLLEFGLDSAPVYGKAGQINLDVSGALGTGKLPEAVEALDLEASGLELERKTGAGKTISMSFEQAHLTRDPESGKLRLDGRGKLDGRTLDIKLRAGTLSQHMAASRRPLNLVLTSGRSRLRVDGHFTGRGEEVKYQIQLEGSAEKLDDPGHLALIELPPVGPVSISGRLSGNRHELNWKDTRLTIGTTHLDSDGRLRFAGGKLHYSAKARLLAKEYELLISELFPDFPHVGNVEALMDVKGDNRGLEIQFQKFNVQDSRLTGRMQVRFSKDKPKLIIEADVDPLQLATFFKKSETDGAAAHTADDKARVIPDLVINTNILKLVDLESKVVVHNLLHGENNLGSYTLSSGIRDQVFTTDANIRSAYISDTKVHGVLSARKEVPEIRLQVENQDLDYGGLLKALDIADKVTGKLDFRLDVRGQGRRLPELLAAANGTLKVDGGEGEIDYAQLRLWGGNLVELLVPTRVRGDEKSHVNCLAAHFEMEPGLFKSKGIVLDTDVSTIGGALQVALPSEALQGGFQPKPKGVRLFTVDTPISLGGTLANPTAEALGAGTLLTAGKLATGLYNPVLLVAMFGSMGSNVENPCEAVLSGVENYAQGDSQAKALDDAGKELGKAGKGVTDAISQPFRKLFGGGKKDGQASPGTQNTPAE